MTISQSCTTQGSRRSWAAAWGLSLRRALTGWREHRRVKADLARLAEAGDYLLLDIGLDPKLARENPGALLDQITRENAG
jgi:uncharacterized protein YjiS (DUF1127 family)